MLLLFLMSCRRDGPAVLRFPLPSILASLALGAAVPVQAQQASPPTAIVRGYVWDSLLTGAVLPNARVTVSGPAARTLITDGRGRFVFDSLEPGAYTVSFFHPALDQLGYTPPEMSLQVEPGGVYPIFLSTVSGVAVHGALCRGPQAAQTGVVFGRLANVRTGAPIIGGEVRVEWRETRVSTALGVTSGTRAAAATADSVGRYQICGVPNDTPVLLRAQADGVVGPPLELDLAGRPVAFRGLALDLDAPGAIAGDSATGSAVLRGTVRGPDGSPVPEAQVFVLGLPHGTRTNAAGRFHLEGLPAGTYSVESRAIGFSRRRDMVQLRPDEQTELDIRLAGRVLELPEIVVEERVFRNEFEERRSQGRGHFITREEIERRSPIRAEELFRVVPGFTVVSSGMDFAVVSSRAPQASGYCQPDFYVDGTKVTVDPQMGNGLPVGPDEIYGIETYPGSASGAPLQYRSTSGCGLILIWTMRGRLRGQ